MLKQKQFSHAIIPLTQALTLILFLLLPGIGFYGGMKYQQQHESQNSDTPIPKTTPITNPTKHAPDTLVVIRLADSQRNIPAITQTITDKEKVTHLYNDIYALPFPPTGKFNCPMQIPLQYTLDFYENTTHVLNAILSPTGCPTIQLSNEKTRWALNTQGYTFIKDLEQTLQLSEADFYGNAR